MHDWKGTREELEQACKMFEHAIELDPLLEALAECRCDGRATSSSKHNDRVE